MRGFAADLRHAVRLYGRTPGSSAIAVVVLAVGMAFVAAFLSLYVDLVLRPHPGFEQSGRLATVGQSDGPLLSGIAYEIVERMAGEMRSIEGAASFNPQTVLIGTEAEEALTAAVSKGFFEHIRPRVALGRGLRDEDHAADAEPVVVISHGLWRQRFGGDPAALGTFLEIAKDPNTFYRSANFMQRVEPEQDSALFRVVGVTAPASGLLPGLDPAVWLPLERIYAIIMGEPATLPRYTGLTLVRLGDGVSAGTFVDELRARYDSQAGFPGRIPGTQLDAIEGIVSNVNVQREARRQLELFLIGSVLLALVAAANVSLFLLARAPGRRRELGIRLAVGAPLGRIGRQLATEAGLLVVTAMGLGLPGSVWLGLWLRGIALFQDADWRDVTLLDWRVLGLTGGLLVVITALVSLAPMLSVRRVGIAASSRAATARASLAQRFAGTLQIAVAGALGAAAVAFAWYLGVLMFSNPGYTTADRYLIEGIADGIGGTAADFALEIDRRRAVVESIPGVSAMAVGSVVPGGEAAQRRYIFPQRLPDPASSESTIELYPGSLDERFVDLLGFRLIAGRAPEPAEVSAVAVNQTLARAIWGHEDVVGERLHWSYWGPAGAEVVGVIEDLSYDHPVAPPLPYFFGSPRGDLGFPIAVVETRLPAAELKRALDARARDGSLEARVGSIFSLEDIRMNLIAADRARGLLTIATAALVVALAALGFYSTQRYLVAAGRREYAIRASLGAGPAALGRLVYLRGLTLGLPGLVLGVLLAFIVAAWLRGDFVARDITPWPVAIGVGAGLVVLLLAASAGPARQARRTEPAPLLRQD